MHKKTSVVFRSGTHTLIFLLAAIAVVFYFDYPRIFHLAPQGPHLWRQADGASIALNYYQFDGSFWSPQVHNAQSGDYHAVSEFPLIYYLSSWAYRLFGVQEGWLRSITLSFLLVGLLAFAKLIRGLLQDDFLSILLPLLIWSSPFLAFYAFNFLPNAPALGMVFVGWYFVWRYYKQNHLRHWHLALLFFLLAALLKLTTLTNLLALLAVWCWQQRNDLLSQLRLQLKLLPGLLVLFTSLFSWLAFAKYYNELHHSTLFLATIRPIWELDGPRINFIFNRNVFHISRYYYPWYTHGLVLLLSGYIIFAIRKSHPLFQLLLFLFGGILSLVALWYQQFDIHYYYAIEYLIFPAAVFVIGCWCLQRRYPGFLKHWLTRLLLVIFLLANLYQARSLLLYRYNGDNVYNPPFSKYCLQHQELRQHLRTIGLKPSDKVMAIPDGSPNALLYLLNQRGYSTFAWGGHQLTDKRVKWRVNNYNVDYLIVASKDWLKNQPAKEVLQYPLESFREEVLIFDLRPFRTSTPASE